MLGPPHLLGFLGALAFWAGVVVLVIWAIRSFTNRPALRAAAASSAPHAPPDPR